MDNEFMVGMGKIAVESAPAILSSLGLGSCVGVAIFDEHSKLGGLAHIMLPKSREDPKKSLNSALVSVKNTTQNSQIKKDLSLFNIQNIFDVNKDELVEKYKTQRPNLVVFEITNLAEESYYLEQIKEFDMDANIILTGDVDTELKPSFYNQDIFIINNQFLSKELEQVLDLIQNKKELKFADIAMSHLLNLMKSKGSNQKNMVAKIAGGASMFKTVTDSPFAQIGDNNVAAVKKILEEQKIKLISEDTGGNSGRTVRFYLDTGKFTVKTKNEVKEI